MEATPEGEVKPTENSVESEVGGTGNSEIEIEVDKTKNFALEGEVELTQNPIVESEVESAKNSGESEVSDTENFEAEREGEQSTETSSVVLVKSKTESAYDLKSVRLALRSPEESVSHSQAALDNESEASGLQGGDSMSC